MIKEHDELNRNTKGIDFNTSLKQLKDNVKEVAEGSECGVMCLNYNLWQKLDQIEAFDMLEKQKRL